MKLPEMANPPPSLDPNVTDAAAGQKINLAKIKQK